MVGPTMSTTAMANSLYYVKALYAAGDHQFSINMVHNMVGT